MLLAKKEMEKCFDSCREPKKTSGHGPADHQLEMVNFNGSFFHKVGIVRVHNNNLKSVKCWCYQGICFEAKSMAQSFAEVLSKTPPPKDVPFLRQDFMRARIAFKKWQTTWYGKNGLTYDEMDSQLLVERRTKGKDPFGITGLLG